MSKHLDCKEESFEKKKWGLKKSGKICLDFEYLTYVEDHVAMVAPNHNGRDDLFW